MSDITHETGIYIVMGLTDSCHHDNEFLLRCQESGKHLPLRQPQSTNQVAPRRTQKTTYRGKKTLYCSRHTNKNVQGLPRDAQPSEVNTQPVQKTTLAPHANSIPSFTTSHIISPSISPTCSPFTTLLAVPHLCNVPSHPYPIPAIPRRRTPPLPIHLPPPLPRHIMSYLAGGTLSFFCRSTRTLSPTCLYTSTSVLKAVSRTAAAGSLSSFTIDGSSRDNWIACAP